MMRAILTILAALVATAACQADPSSDAKAALSLSAAAKQSLPAGSTDALEEVNALRARHGLPAFQRDDNLTLAAAKCADFRVRNRIGGHTSNDFAFLPSGCWADAAGIGITSSHFAACCVYENWTYAGAAVVEVGGVKYCQIFVRHAPPTKGKSDCKECATTKIETYVRPLTLLEVLRERRIERLKAMQARSFSRPVLFVERPLLRLRLFGGCCR